MPLSLNYVNLLTNPAIATALIAAWDYFMHPIYSRNTIITDAVCMASSLIITDLITNLGLSEILPVQSDSAQNKLIKLVISTYLYYLFFRQFVNGISNSSVMGLSSKQENILVAVVVSLVSNTLEAPVKSMLL